jgi:uncharacterized membrane protein
MLDKKEKVVIGCLAVVAIFYCIVEAFNEGDLSIYLSAAGELKSHGNIYTTTYIQEQYHYYYSVMFAIVLLPFYAMPYYWVKLGWLLLNLSLFVHLLSLLWSSNFVRKLSRARQRWFTILVLVFSFRFLHQNIHAAQITILILWCATYGVLLVCRGRSISGALLLAIGINIKLLPIVFIPYLLYRGYFKACAFVLIFLLIGFLLPSVFIGHEYNLSLFSSWLRMINPANSEHVLDVDERSFHGLSTLLATLFVGQVPDWYALNLKRNIANVSLETLSLMLFCVRVALVLLTFYFLRFKPFTRVRYAWQQVLEISYILLLIPLLFPHQQHYAFLFTVPAFSVVLYYLILKKEVLPRSQFRFITGILIVIYLSANLKILLGAFNDYYEHFKILTYGALLLIPLLLWVGRDRSFQPEPVLE